MAKMRSPRPFRRADADAVLQLLEELPRIHASQDGPYTFRDRASDFRAVFSGTSSAEQGMRVLSQIHQICDPSPRREDADHQGRMAFDLGKRRVMAEIMLCMVAKEPVRVERSEKDERRS